MLGAHRCALALQVDPQLCETADVAARNHTRPRRDDRLRLLAAERVGQLRLVEIVSAGAAAAEVSVGQFAQFNPRNGPKQLAAAVQPFG